MVLLLFFRDVYTMHHRDVCVIIIIDHFYMLPLLYIAFVFLFLFPEMFTPCITGTCVLLLSLITFICYRFYILPLFFFFFFQRCLCHASQECVCYYYHWSLLYITAFIYCLCFSFSFSRDVYAMHHRNVCVIIIIDHFYILPLLYIAFVFLFLFPEMFTPCITGTCVLLLSMITFIYYRFYILPLFFFFFFQRCLRHASQACVCYYYHWSHLYITAIPGSQADPLHLWIERIAYLDISTGHHYRLFRQRSAPRAHVAQENQGTNCTG